MKKFNYTTGMTHTGVFHADDVFSTALLRILSPEISVTREFKIPDNVPEDTIVFDIGLGRYDHHQKEAEIRDNGIKYAAFGLLWREFGELLVSRKNVEKFDTNFVQAIDEADNGGSLNPMSSAISAFIPNWDDEEQNMDKAFDKAVDFAIEVLNREFGRLHSSERAETEVQNALDNSDGEIVVLERFVPWQDVLIPSTAKFVIFPSLRGGFSAQAIPSVLGGRDQKVPFPAEWAGGKEEALQKILPGMTFCHPGRFMISCITIEQAVMACEKAMDFI